jgi:hypothetical protein
MENGAERGEGPVASPGWKLWASKRWLQATEFDALSNLWPSVRRGSSADEPASGMNKTGEAAELPRRLGLCGGVAGDWMVLTDIWVTVTVCLRQGAARGNSRRDSDRALAEPGSTRSPGWRGAQRRGGRNCKGRGSVNGNQGVGWSRQQAG